jgi:hypothetical protein
MPELMAIPLALVLLGAIFALIFAGSTGFWAWVLVIVAILSALFAVLAVVARRARPAPVGGATPFAGAAPPVRDGVHRALLVIDDACSTPELEQLARAPGDGHAVFVVAPAVSSRLARITGDEAAYQRAKDRLETTVQRLAELGLEASGHVGSHDPLQAADEGLREFPADEVVFALHPGEETDWLEQGVVEAARARYRVPVRELSAAVRDGGG